MPGPADPPSARCGTDSSFDNLPSDMRPGWSPSRNFDSEHIYWDQASVLAQVGLLDPTGLPVTGVKQAEAVATDAGAELFNALIMKPGTDSK